SPSATRRSPRRWRTGGVASSSPTDIRLSSFSIVRSFVPWPRGRAALPRLLRNYLISEPAHRNDQFRIRGVLLYLGAQALDVGVDQPQVVALVTPNPFEQRLAAEDLPGLL